MEKFPISKPNEHPIVSTSASSSLLLGGSEVKFPWKP